MEARSDLDEYCRICPLDDCYDNDPRCKRGQELRARSKTSKPKGLPLKTSLETDVEIRQRHAAGGISMRQLGREYRVSGNTIMAIVKHPQERDELRARRAAHGNRIQPR